MRENVAVIDIGSNSIRMSIMRVGEDYSYRMICQMKEALRLSAQLDEEGVLPPETIQRTIQIMRAFRRQIRLHGVKRVRAVATAALRQAENRAAVVEEIRRETDIYVEIISGETEAFYDYLGVVYSVPLEDFVLIDTGGGSTEIVLVEKRKMTARISIPYGAVVLGKMFGENHAEMKQFLRQKLRELPFLPQCKGLPVVGLGGSIRALGKAHCFHRRQPLVSIHEYPLSRSEAEEIYQQLCQMPPAKRERTYAVSESRRDIIVSGLAPLMALLKETDAQNIVISGNGVREGIFFELCIPFQADMHVLRSSIENSMRLYGLGQDYAAALYEEACILANPYPSLTPYGHVLYAACMLSELGKQIDYYNHSRHTFFVITGLPIYGLSPAERVMCACVAATLGKTAARGIYAKFHSLLSQKQVEAARQLSAVVRVASTLLFYGFHCRRLSFDRNKQKLYLTVQAQQEGIVLPEAARISLQKCWRETFGVKCKIQIENNDVE